MRRPRLLLAALVAAVSTLVLPIASPLAPPAAAAERDLTILSDARYDVQPADARVRVTVNLDVRYRRKETTTRRYYVDHAFLAVPPGTTGFRISGDGGPGVRVAKKEKTHTLLRIDFGSRLYGGGSRELRLRFDLPDPGGSPTRQLRVSEALVAFPAWAYASDGAGPSTVTVVFPPGYKVDVETGSMPDRTTTEDGRQVLRSGAIARPGTWFAYVLGQGPGAFAETTVETTVAGEPVRLTLRAWQDDPAWAERVGELLVRALPVLGEATGLAWTSADPFVIVEAASRTSQGYAGLFEPAEGRAEIAYYADTFVVLHEAAHGWFNGALLADRWANEGFSSAYAERAAATLELEVAPDELTDDLRATAVPLNAWNPQADPASEDYGYAASLALAREVLERAGDEAMRDVWAAARDGVGAYQPPSADGAPAGDPETVDGPPDWRGLLDLLEDRTRQPFDDLWERWVARPAETRLLEDRRVARASYRRTIALADGWALPRGVRDALRAWQFDAVETYLADLRTIVARREALEAAAAAAGLTLADTVRPAFEAGLLAEAAEAIDVQVEAVERIEAAEAARPADPDLLTQLGLYEEHPDVDLVAARAAFSAGEIEDALRSADAARRTWNGAWDAGRQRILVGLVYVAAAMLVASLAMGAVRRRGRDRRVPRQAVPSR